MGDEFRQGDGVGDSGSKSLGSGDSGLSVVMLVHNDMRADARVMREASALAAAGHSVAVLALRGDLLPESQFRDGYEIIRVGELTSAPGRAFLSKARQARAREKAFVREALSRKPDVVHCHDTDTLTAGGRIARFAGASLVYDAHELFPDMLAGHGRRSVAVQAYWRRVERRLIPRTDLVITVSRLLGSVLRERYGVVPIVVRNVSGLEPELNSDRLRRELGLSAETPIVLYQGGLIGGRALVRLVRSMALVENVVLVMQGAGPEERLIRAAIAESGLEERVLLTGWVSPDTLHEYACGADVGVVIYESTSLNNYYAGPNKLYAYLMAGLPMVASDFPGLREVVVDEGVGAAFDPTSEESIAEAIRGVLSDAVRRERMSRSARRLAETCFNWELESQVLIDAYDRLQSGDVA